MLKIDMELVRGIEASLPRRLIVEAIASLCVRMGIKVIAEGIETHEELEAVRGSASAMSRVSSSAAGDRHSAAGAASGEQFGNRCLELQRGDDPAHHGAWEEPIGLALNLFVRPGMTIALLQSSPCRASRDDGRASAENLSKRGLVTPATSPNSVAVGRGRGRTP
jgi:hypothetical protein